MEDNTNSKETNSCDIQTAAALCVKMWAHYSLKQTEKIHDVLRVEFVPVSIQGVCGNTEWHLDEDASSNMIGNILFSKQYF